MTSRQKIERAATDRGLKIIHLVYETPVGLQMGDVDGGWLLVAETAAANGLTPDDLIANLDERLGGYMPV